MVIERKLAFWVGLVFVSIGNGFAIASWVLLQNILLTVLSALVSIPFDMYLFYLLLIVRRKPQYPLAPPEGKWDMYLPRTDIPRPVIADFREIEEKKRKFAKIKQMNRKKVVRKKK